MVDELCALLEKVEINPKGSDQDLIQKLPAHLANARTCQRHVPFVFFYVSNEKDKAILSAQLREDVE
eukprot:11722035-Prorocentrum_lima.AAC.1